MYYEEYKDKEYIQYINNVLEDKIVVCNAIKQAVQRIIVLSQKEEYYIDFNAVDRVINFIGLIRHYLGKHSGKHFKLLNWQQFMLFCIYGLKHKKDNTRVTRNVYIQMARKNGKSAICAALSLYHLIADNEQAAQIFFAANSREQAKILLDITSNFAKSLDPKNKFLTIYRDTIKLNNNFIKVVSADTSKLDGYNLSFAVIDEVHEAKDSRMSDIISSSMGMREQPLLIEITTAGFNQFSYCNEKYNTAKEILSGIKEDDSLQAFIFELDEEDNWDNKEVWGKANPCLGITVTEDYLASEIQKAKNTSSLEVSVKTKNLNMWVQSSSVWISDNIINKSIQNIDLNFFKDKDVFAYVGVDLAAVADLTAISILITYNEKYYFKQYYFLPEDTINISENSELYKKWKRKKFLTVTQGNVTDYDYITKLLKQINEIIPISKIAYDSWNATQWAIQATAEGLPLEPFSQAIGNFNRPTKEFERLLLSGKVVIDNNEITKYCLQNVVIKTDHNDNAKPVKQQRQNKIDGVIAMLQSLGIMLQQPSFSNEIFSI
ncbi:terminase large subunit [Phocaeicola barnesiae]|uniref:Terminase large subunit n=1 Tax=Phocaeicola barnesiae TaxID=376804 RepID=A0AAW5N8R0_9BACT|nr:terminase TerL endonuclease subunit [Phocaeicola barnesiae]MCR8874882.1 terminase large subunit [Phocaeicola barnesiae]